MVKVIAQKVGYYGGKVREIGEEFELINDDWSDEEKRPSWVRLAEGEVLPEPEPARPKERQGKGKPDKVKPEEEAKDQAS